VSLHCPLSFCFNPRSPHSSSGGGLPAKGAPTLKLALGYHSNINRVFIRTFTHGHCSLIYWKRLTLLQYDWFRYCHMQLLQTTAVSGCL